MATFTNQNKSSTSFSNQSKNSASFTPQTKGDITTFGALTNDQIGTLSNDDIFQGRPVGDWANSDAAVATTWSNASRN